MFKKIIYYCSILILLSNVWLAELQTEFKNIKGKTDISLVSSDIFRTTLEVSVDDYVLIPTDENGNRYKVYIDKSTSILQLGSPDLPKISTSIIIPDNAKMEINITNSEYLEYTNVPIAPSKGNISRDVNPNDIPFVYGDIYKENEFYPGNLADLDSPYILRDLRGQTVKFYPVQYNPFTKVLRIYSKISVEITASGNSDVNTISRGTNNIKTDNEFLHMYNNLFINSNTDTRFEYLADEGSMLVICYDDFLDEMQPFVEWKNKKGIPTEMFGINEIGSSASSMQEFIDNYYYDNNLTYLLLVGDINQIPTHIVSGSASDPSFGFISGNDSFAEVIVGRFSANNPGELQTQIDRSLDYELAPTAVDHFDSALGIASNQGPGYGGLSDAAFNDLLWNDFLSAYTYESYEGIYDPSGSVNDGIVAINNGVGIINYTGHSGPTGWGNGAPLDVNDVNNLTNVGMLPFIFTVGCNPGQFNDYSECFAEAWMRATDSDGNAIGAIGHLGSTISQSWEPPMHGQWAMNSILTESYEENISRSYGGIAVNGCMHMNEAQGSSGINETKYWTIFGDPSLLVRTDQPSDISAIYDEGILIGQEQFIVDVGFDGALVSLSFNGTLLTSSYSNGGIAILDLSSLDLEPGEIDLVITSFNTYPHQSTLYVIAQECSIGDLNQDLTVDVVDVILAVNIILNITENPSYMETCAADTNADGEINILDVLAIINLILGN